MFDQVWTKEVLEEICSRSAGGEGVKAIIATLDDPRGGKLDPEQGIDWLHKYHQGRIQSAKKAQIAARTAQDIARATKSKPEASEAKPEKEAA